MTEIEGDERAASAGEMDTGRVLALSDGVFAIAATLLVLDLRLPDGLTAEEVPTRLHELLPAFGGYALGYVLIGLLWLGHHRQFRNFRRISVRLARLNLLFLGSVSVLPFVTTLLHYDIAIAVQLYAGTIALIFLLEALMGLVAEHRGHHADPLAGRALTYRATAMAVVFLLSIPVAGAGADGPALAKYFWLLAIPVRLVLHLTRRPRGRRGAGGSAMVSR
jgi:uncharacterized membrane protein